MDMKIQGRKSQYPMGMTSPLGGVKPQPELEETAAPIETDHVELNVSTAQVQMLKDAVKAIPSVRIEMVQALKQEIEHGHYYVSSDKLARKVVDEALREALHRQLSASENA